MTDKQAYIYRIIDAWWKKHGFAPSIDDIMDITGDKGRGNVHRTMKKLVELGHCKMVPRRARSIRPSYLKVYKLDIE
jgi:SOS-response transcriptional repressor LexA